MVKKYKHCGIDGVGFQSHIQVDFTDDMMDGVRENMKRYEDIGIDVEITELDVKCKPNANKQCETEWTPELL